MSICNISAQKRRFNMIPPTPADMRRKRLNNTIDTPTPTKKPRSTPSQQSRLNSTLDTPGYFFNIPNRGGCANFSVKVPSLETITDEDSISDISSIQTNNR